MKLLATLVQLRMMRGNYRELPNTHFFLLIYVAGKTTPALAAGFFFAWALASHNHSEMWLFGILTLFAALFAFGAVTLRKRGKFFGVADMLSSRRGQ
jgi:hypothetical protein